ncbi:hypothetical protein L1887_42926 [Cichorium endivia]|nr:hypothetical protein L1887_42926 [Cichorium endivia]
MRSYIAGFYSSIDYGDLSSDFEGVLEIRPAQPVASVPVMHQSANLNRNNDYIQSASAVNLNSASTDPAASASNLAGRRSYPQTVCRHWL